MLAAALDAAAAAAAPAAGFSVEPAVPQPITPPAVACAQSLESASHHGQTGAAAAGGKAAAPPTSAGPGRPHLAAAYANALARSDQPTGPDSLAGAVREWQGALDAGVSGMAEKQGGSARQLALPQLQARMERLRALRVSQAPQH